MKKICFRVDANNEIGIGHMMRCLTLAEELCNNQKMQCIFAVSDEMSAEILKHTCFEYIILHIDYKDYSKYSAELLAQLIKQRKLDLVIIDSYFSEQEYFRKIHSLVKTACFWCRKEEISTDLLINYNIDYDISFYQKNFPKSSIRLLLGTDYIPLRKEFMYLSKKKIEQSVRSVLVTTGGGDSRFFMENFLQNDCTLKKYYSITFTLIIGTYSSSYEKLKDICNKKQLQNIRIIPHTSEIEKIMNKSDIAISSGGTLMYEICALGIPSVLYSIADNQKSEAAFLAKEGAVFYAGDINDSTFWKNLFQMLDRLISNYNIRKKLSEKASNLVDGRGICRIAGEVFNLLEEK